MTTERANPALFYDAAIDQRPVKGHTHNLYRYPARFSPSFARAAVETFTAPGDIVLDPFVGGGTSLIEARLAGRRAFGSDISSLAVFLTQTKSIALSKSELMSVEQWFESLPRHLNIHQKTMDTRHGQFVGYERNMPWRLRKTCDQYLNQLVRLPTQRQRRFARCILLRCGQWAMDCRKAIPSVREFRDQLFVVLSESVVAMTEYRKALSRRTKIAGSNQAFRCVQSAAADLSREQLSWNERTSAKLVLTSPPYPGVHVLYHRWNVRGRRESPAPFWIAGCLDGHGCVHYTLGDRHQESLTNYFDGIRRSFSSIRRLIADDGLVVQLVAFSSPNWQLDAYLNAMQDAGFVEALPSEVGIQCRDRLWRRVPGRRWYSMIRGDIPSSCELVLFHRPKPE